MTIPEHRLSAWRAHRVVEPRVVWAPSFDGGLPPSVVAVGSGGGIATKHATMPAVELAVSSAAGAQASLVSREHFRGPMGVRYGATVIHSDPGQLAQVRYWGRFGDQGQGVYFRLSGTELALVLTSRASGSSVSETVARAAWNAKNTAIDLTKLHRFEIEVSVTGARAFVDDELVHTFTEEGVLANTIATLAALPFAAIVGNTGPSAPASMKVTEPFVAVHGELPAGGSFAASRESALSVGGVHLLSVRPKSAFGGSPNTASVHPTRLVARAGAQGCTFRLLLNATPTGEAFADQDAVSVVEADTAATIAAGTLVAELTLGPDQGGELDLREVFGWGRRALCVPLSASPTGDLLSIIGVASSGTPTGRAALMWNEVR